MLTFVAIVVAVDLLGGAIHRGRHRRRLPPVRPEGQRHQARPVCLLRQELDRSADVWMIGSTDSKYISVILFGSCIVHASVFS